MSAKKARKERKVIADKSQKLIGKIATDELVIHYETIYKKYIDERSKNRLLMAQIYGARVALFAAATVLIINIVVYFKHFA
jgi:hypothetical protein